MLKKIQNNTEWACHTRVLHRLKQLSGEEYARGSQLNIDIGKMTTVAVNYCLQRFVQKVRKVCGVTTRSVKVHKGL